MKNSHLYLYIGLAVLVGILGAGWYASSGGKFTLSAGGNAFSNQGGVSNTGGFNPNIKPTLGTGAAYMDQLNHNLNTTAQVALNLSIKGQSYSYRQLLSNTPGLVTDQNVSYGTCVNVTFGDSKTTSYYSVQFLNASIGCSIQIAQSSTNLQFTGLQKEAAINKITWNNATGTYITWTGANTIGTSIITPGVAVVGGSTYSVSYTVYPGSGYYGGGGVIQYFTANSGNVAGISLTGPIGTYSGAPGVEPQTSATYPSTYNTYSGSRTWAFLTPAFTVWGPGGSQSFTVSLTTQSSLGTNTIVNFGINDCPNFYQNGHLQGTCQNGGLNPNTAADLGEALTMQGGTQDVCAVGTPAAKCPVSLYAPGNTLFTTSDLGPIGLLAAR